MVKPPFPALVCSKIDSFAEVIRIFFLKISGLHIGRYCTVGRISCQWPHKLFIGDNTKIREGVSFWFRDPFDPENSTVIGKSVFIGRNCEFNCSDKIIVGDNCLIASNTVIVDSGHQYENSKLISKQPVIAKMIHIEDDVWIGSSCTILRGVTLGKGCIIGAHSLVNKSVPPYEIWGGVPARKISERT